MKFVVDFLKMFFYLFMRMAPIWGFLSVVITVLGLLVGRLEGLAASRGIYFAWITATTVGYGDIAPDRPLARVLCVVLALIGIINSGLLVSIALLAGEVAAKRNLNVEELKKRVGGDLPRPR